MRKITNLILSLTLFLISMGCETNDPEAENAEEIITDVTLSFDGLGGAAPLEFMAVDPDGDGPQNLEIQGDIILAPNTEYVLTLDLQNGIENESISEEVEEEADEHMLFYAWTNELFGTPTGDGNIDSRSDKVAYIDFDGNGLPLGLETTWITGDIGTGTFRVVLKHQPGDIKTATSESTNGETDLDLTWNISVQ